MLGFEQAHDVLEFLVSACATVYTYKADFKSRLKVDTSLKSFSFVHETKRNQTGKNKQYIRSVLLKQAYWEHVARVRFPNFQVSARQSKKKT